MGLGANAFSEDAVRNIFKAKGRPLTGIARFRSKKRFS